MSGAEGRLVADLNHRARAHRLDGETPTRTVRLADGTTASTGDVVITRVNDRRLRISATDWVKNGDRWTIRRVGDDDSLTVAHARSSKARGQYGQCRQIAPSGRHK